MIIIEKGCNYCQSSGLSGKEDGTNCFSCNGSGLKKDQDTSIIVCRSCDGYGDGPTEYIKYCPECNGLGWTQIDVSTENSQKPDDHDDDSIFVITKGEEFFTANQIRKDSTAKPICFEHYELLTVHRRKDNTSFQVVKVQIEGHEHYFPVYKNRKLDIEETLVLRRFKTNFSNSKDAQIMWYALQEP